MKTNDPSILINTYCLIFDYPIKSSTDWAAFRAHFLTAKFFDDNLDFHRHATANSTITEMPVIQYGEINGYAALLGIQRGAELVRQLQVKGMLQAPLHLLKQPAIQFQHSLKLSGEPCTYKVLRLDLKIKPAEWHKMKNVGEQYGLLERKLIASLLSYAREFSFQVPKRIEVTIQHFEVWKELNYYKKKRNTNELLKERQNSQRAILKPFKVLVDIHFNTNIYLPKLFTLGAEKASGYGWGYQSDSVKELKMKELFEDRLDVFLSE